MTEIPLTEEWLASVGFKYREPGQRQTFRHWTLTFNEPHDYGLYIQTTMPGHIDKEGRHVGMRHGWHLWVGRSDCSCFLHLRRVFWRSDIIAIVEAFSGQPWSPTKAGHVPCINREAQLEKMASSAIRPNPQPSQNGAG